MNRPTTWYLVNGFAVALLLLAFQGFNWAGNIIIGWVWLNLILTLAVCYVDPVRKKARETGHSVSQNNALAFDGLFFLGLCAAGFWVTAIAHIIQAMHEQIIFFADQPDKEPAP